MTETALTQAMDDDCLSSADSFAVVADDNNFNEEDHDSVTNIEPAIRKLAHQLESSGIHPSLPVIVEVAKVTYRDFSVGIFTESNERNPRRFFFEPIVLLDPKSIINESHGFFKQDFVRFTIQMWNTDIRSKVLHRLQSLPDYKHLDINEDDISVMPYEDIYLDFKPGSIHQSLRLMEQPPSYARSSESIDFYFLCDLPSTANVMAEDFRRNPEFALKTWQLALKCNDLALKNGVTSKLSMDGFKPNQMKPTFLFNVSINRFETGTMESLMRRLADLEKRTASTKESGVFSVKNCINPTAAANKSFGYLTVDFDTETEFGDLDLTTGIFTVQQPGLYQVNFNSNVYMTSGSYYRSFEMRLNGVSHARYNNQVYDSGGCGVYQPVNISALLPLKVGDKIGIFAISGNLHEDASKHYITRFSCLFLSGK